MSRVRAKVTFLTARRGVCGTIRSRRGGCIEDGPKPRCVPALRCSKGAPKYRAKLIQITLEQDVNPIYWGNYLIDCFGLCDGITAGMAGV